MPERVLVFGASGYVGRHLTARLAAQGHRVRAAARRLAPLEAEGWEGVELVAADALTPASLPAPLEAVDVAYYLVHSMAAGGDFPARDRDAASHFAAAAATAGVRRIVYLGGLAPADPDTPHLASRVETGDILRRGSVPVTELRAGIIVGPGSAAFEVMRDLVAHLPVMVTPRWIYSRSPPLALDELLGYLTALPWIDEAAGKVLEAGGPERYTYEAMMRELARRLGRRQPWIIPVPLLTPKLSSYWLALVTATPVNVASALITGLKHDLSADDGELRRLVPDQPRIGFTDAIARVFAAEEGIKATDRWREGAFELRGHRHDVSFYGKTLTMTAAALVPAAAVWRVLARLGDEADGYFFLDRVWRLRSWIDRLLGGRDAGRREAGEPLQPGTRFDFWRVLAVEPGRRLTLVSSLRAPGAGGMEFTLSPTATTSTLAATIHWHPAGFWGLLYWYALWPIHAAMLAGMVRAISLEAEAEAATRGSTPAPRAGPDGESGSRRPAAAARAPAGRRGSPSPRRRRSAR
jgi:uncharacterized protein YbjT (DUF2867 family)